LKSTYDGNVRIGIKNGKENSCSELQATLEFNIIGLKAINDNISLQQSLSGFGFVYLTTNRPAIENKYKRVSS
jgi:hypothetical protein